MNGRNALTAAFAALVLAGGLAACGGAHTTPAANPTASCVLLVGMPPRGAGVSASYARRAAARAAGTPIAGDVSDWARSVETSTAAIRAMSRSAALQMLQRGQRELAAIAAYCSRHGVSGVFPS